MPLLLRHTHFHNHVTNVCIKRFFVSYISQNCRTIGLHDSLLFPTICFSPMHYHMSLSMACFLLFLSAIGHKQHHPWTTFTCALGCSHFFTENIIDTITAGGMNECIPPIQHIRHNLIAYVGSIYLASTFRSSASPCSINNYIQRHRNAQEAGVSPSSEAYSQHTPVHDVKSCSNTGRRPLDYLADIRVSHHSGIPCVEIYSNINITRRLQISFLSCTIIAWNQLPSIIIAAPSIDAFRSRHTANLP